MIRDTFIETGKKPTHRLKNVTDFMWSYEDDQTKPTWDMLQSAYSFYNQKLLRLCYGLVV